MLTIGIPCYGGQMFGTFACALFELQARLTEERVPYSVDWIFNESLIVRARNRIASHFIQSDSQVLQFLDADLEFDPGAVLAQIGHVLHPDGPKLAGGNYHTKAYNPDGIANGYEQGLRGEDMLRAGLRGVTNYRGQDGNNVAMSPHAEVEAWFFEGHMYLRANHLPTGLLTVHRDVLTATQRNSENPAKPYFGSSVCPVHYDFFGLLLQERSDAGSVANPDGLPDLLSEDYAFCKRAAEAGYEAWGNTNNVAKHWGTHRFG